LKNFGFVDELTVVAPGINGKMSEFNAALGLLQLKYIDEALGKRREIDITYRKLLRNVAGIRCLSDAGEVDANYAYFPIFVDRPYPLDRDDLYKLMKLHDIHPRRYFYPLISEFPMYRGLPSSNIGSLPVATDAASRVLCLPIYPSLTLEDVQRVVDLIVDPISAFKNSTSSIATP
jgi:dTDP-4-amino-4,6-dideoxygalactose transaminase